MNEKDTDEHITALVREGTRLTLSVLNLIRSMEKLNERTAIMAIKIAALEGLAGIGDLNQPHGE